MASEVDLSQMAVTVRVEVAAPIAVVWTLLTDVGTMAQFSPEVVSARWIGAGRPTIGSRFSVINRRGKLEWNVTCVVVRADDPESFGWTVGEPSCPSSTWHYRLEAVADDRTIVTQSFQHGPNRSNIRAMIEKEPDRKDSIIARRSMTLFADMTSTLLAASAFLSND